MSSLGHVLRDLLDTRSTDFHSSPATEGVESTRRNSVCPSSLFSFPPFPSPVFFSLLTKFFPSSNIFLLFLLQNEGLTKHLSASNTPFTSTLLFSSFDQNIFILHIFSSFSFSSMCIITSKMINNTRLLRGFTDPYNHTYSESL